MERKNIVVMFGGVSPEHEVSVITGMQILKNIDKERYNPIVIYIDKKGLNWILPNYKKESDFLNPNRKLVIFGKDENGGFLMYRSFPLKKIYIDCVYLTLHGGMGELGIVQGMLETHSIPYTSPNVESSVLCMNKQLSKILTAYSGIPVVDGISIFSNDIQKNVDINVEKVKREIGLPVIIKPVHLGSSIGLYICKSDIELKKNLLISSQLDDEIMIEKLLPDITEYNISVSTKNNEIIFSAIEKPLRKDEILSFKDKYENGAKGKLAGGGMASLSRELPANISPEFKNQILEYAKIIYTTLKCKGLVRIDFIYSNSKLYFSEINPIPGALSFFLWEEVGELFKDQISRVIEESIMNKQEQIGYSFDYDTDIVEKYIKAVSKKDL
jgi:D-alanine-D-alanine ligase